MPQEQKHSKAQEHVKPFLPSPRLRQAGDLREFVRDVVRSFVPSAYARLAAQPASTAAFYLGGVVFLVTLLLTPLIYVEQEHVRSIRRDHYERILPDELYFESGTADYKGEQPYVRVDTFGDERRVYIVDTTGQTTEVPAEYAYGMLITRDKIIETVHASEDGSKTFDSPIPETQGRTRAKAFFLNAIDQERWPTLVNVVGLLFLLAVVLLFALATLVAALSAAIEATRKESRVPFRACFAVATHAATPVAFIAASRLAVRTVPQFYLVVGGPLLAFMLLVSLGMQAYRRSLEARPEAREARPEAREARPEAREARPEAREARPEAKRFK